MTHTEYADFERRFADFMEREGIENLSTGDDYNEFSSHPCDCCRRHWAGSRWDASGYNRTTEEVQDGYNICEDCRYYAEYGVLDDMTMMDVERSREEAAKSAAERYADEQLEQLD